MKTATSCSWASLFCLFLFACQAQAPQNTTDEIPDLVFPPAYPERIAAQDTSPAWRLKGQKLLITGTVFRRDGKTPAPGVVLYYYHTNTEGRYIHRPEEMRSLAPNEKGQTHGYIRGWVKTDTQGRYAIYTVRPGAYPGGKEPAHIHMTILEPDSRREYYIDDVVFDDDKTLRSARRKKMENRGGSGIVRLLRQKNLLVGERDIVLGLNIPDYPDNGPEYPLVSGRNIGEEVLSFTPRHAYGPDRGTTACPVCQYGRHHGILYFVGNRPDWSDIENWLVFLEAESARRGKYLKVYFVYGNENDDDPAGRLERLGQKLDLKKTALTFVPSFSDTASEIDLNRIHPDAANTLVLYKQNRIIDKFVNLKAGTDNFNRISERLDASINAYFYLD